MGSLDYAELHCHSAFTFLDGASSPEDLVTRASQQGYRALALTDRDGLYGVVRLARAAADVGLHVIAGAEVTLAGGTHLVLLARTLEGYRNLSRLITESRLEAGHGQPLALSFQTLAARAEGLVALSGCGRGELPQALLQGDQRRARELAGRYMEVFGRDGFFLEVHHHLLPGQRRLSTDLECLGAELGLKLVASQNAHYARAEDRCLHDVLTCIRLHTTLAEVGTRLPANGELHLHGVSQLARWHRPEHLRNALDLAMSCEALDLAQLRPRLPAFGDVPPGRPGPRIPDGLSEADYLRRLALAGAQQRHGGEIPQGTSRRLEEELALIERLELAGYFLICWDVARFCRERGILAQGRGSAAASAVCYCLGITAVDPVRLDLPFERFLSERRVLGGAGDGVVAEPPDIDIDIAHRDREQVIQYVYERYGRENVAMVCEVVTWRARSAVRDVGKVLGLSLPQIDGLARSLDRDGLPVQGPIEGAGPMGALLAELCRRIQGLPRHLSIHVGGMVLARRPVADIVPVECAAMPGRTIIQWDKDDAAAAGLVKFDLLGLGMLTMLGDACDLVAQRHGIEVDLARLEPTDPAVYDMLCKADTVGVFQVESRAQMSCLPRLRPRCFYDLVVEVALIRPGPIQGAMVHPYLRRRAGEEPVRYPHPAARPVLERTLGVCLFQEQGMRLAVAVAGFSPAKADELRRAMGHKRSHQRMQALSQDLIQGMRAKGIQREAADEILRQLCAFADYGFPESHAASFALLVYASAWLKCHHPAEFTCALLNSQPMGFYAPATVVSDARRHGLVMHPPAVNASGYQCSVESDGGVRIGLRYVRGIGEAQREAIDSARAGGRYETIGDFARRTRIDRGGLRGLALAGVFDELGLTRRQALFEVDAVAAERLAAGPLAPRPHEDPVDLPLLTSREEAEADFLATGLSTSHGWLDVLDDVPRSGGLDAKALWDQPDGVVVEVVGAVICRQAPPTARGCVFLTLEDSSGLISVVVRSRVADRCWGAVRSSPFVSVTGRLQRQSGTVSVLAEQVRKLGAESSQAFVASRDFH